MQTQLENQGKKGKKRIDMMQTVVDSVGVVLTWSVRGLCAFPNMAINANIARKSGGKRQKKKRYDADCC